ncbi:MAG: hypothetical protein MRECE_16c006 [Mycoplasmataceae bacterium CE_OT135]|nr:MAG: hypothetical protein MRECE_16c006 [Mycoplasmataceae bacterium CE_OT135]
MLLGLDQFFVFLFLTLCKINLLKLKILISWNFD